MVPVPGISGYYYRIIMREGRVTDRTRRDGSLRGIHDFVFSHDNSPAPPRLDVPHGHGPPAAPVLPILPPVESDALHPQVHAPQCSDELSP
jgi:hypothetical protein